MFERSEIAALLAQDDFRNLRERLAETATDVDQRGLWVGPQFDWLSKAGVLGWVIPEEFQGTDVSPAELLAGYELLAESCLTTTFVLTQRNGACQRIAGSENRVARETLLPQLVTGDIFATVGISHLTTSRQHLDRPAVAVRETPDGFLFDGVIPWVTGGAAADYIVTGGTLENGEQILAAVPTASPGVAVQAPQTLLALNGSQTGAVTLAEVFVQRDLLLAGPCERVMQTTRGGGAGSLATSALALGVARGAYELIATESSRRPDLEEIRTAFENEFDRVTRRLHHAIQGDATVTAESVRGQANSLVLRMTQAAVAASKGAGFVAEHPAARRVRESLFFLVWSCPQPVVSAALRELAFAAASGDGTI